MTKRADGKFERKPRDTYDTPASAVKPLLDQIDPGTTFAEPCAGSGMLIDELRSHGHHCRWASDIEPRGPYHKADALALTHQHLKFCTYIITNTPWNRKVLHPMLRHFKSLRPTWLLLDADWMHTKQSREFMPYCHLIVSVGRVSWMGNGQSGYDNVCWYLFVLEETHTVFIGR